MEPLPDPLDDRQVIEVLPPPQLPLSTELLYPKNSNLPDWMTLRDHLAREGTLEKEDILELINKFIKIVKAEPNIIELDDPVTIVGDIHGQFYDLLTLLEQSGNPSITKFIFLGDYVDRGCFSVECLLLLYSMKINFSKTFFMLRGNHECRQLTTYFNFKQECI